MSVKYAIKLLVEIEYVMEQCEALENANYLEFFGDFKVRMSIIAYSFEADIVDACFVY